MNLRVATTFIAMVCLTANTAFSAQPPKGAGALQPAVDVVTLKSGKSIRGAIVSGDANGLLMAVSRGWLEQNAPDLFHKAVATDAELQRQTAEQLRDRLKKRLETPPTDPRLVFFLKQELERAKTLLTRQKPAETEFVWLDLEQGKVARVTRASAERQRVAMWAWSESMPNVESRDAADLERDLKLRKIDPTIAPPDISNRLPARLQDDREWAARMAIVEYALGKPLDFQGTGNILARTDVERNEIALAPILSKVLSSQVDSLLKDLTGEGRGTTPTDSTGWLKSVSAQADRIPVSGLRATRVEVNVESNQAAVQSAFAARMPNGSWEIVWSHREAQDSTKPRADMEAKISEDPQVKQVLSTVKSFGLNADDQIRQAIRFGAATMSAQQAADAKFFEFRDRYLKRLDGPPLTWTK